MVPPVGSFIISFLSVFALSLICASSYLALNSNFETEVMNVKQSIKSLVSFSMLQTIWAIGVNLTAAGLCP